MKILQLCNKVPYPPYDGGAIAMLNMAKSFAKNGHEVTMLAMCTDKHRKSTTQIPTDLGRLIKFIYIDINTRISPLKLIINLIFSKQPYIAVRFINKKFAVALTELLQQETFEIIQLEGLYLKPYIPLIRKNHQGILTYRAHNVESEIWHRIADTTSHMFRKWYIKVLAHRLSIFEKDMINRYDLLIPISANDYSWYQANGNNKPGHLTPTGISEENFNPPIKTHHAIDLFYIGALDWIPNQEALLWFIDRVWPTLKEKQPDIRFHIAGRNAPEWLARKFKNSSVNFHGEVENAQQFIDSHSLMVVPLFAGSGLRIKIIEAMARSKPIITTKIGAQGLNITPGKEIIIADNAEEFILAINQLLDDSSRADELQKNAFAFARQNFSDEQIVKNLLYFYMQHLA